MADSKYDEVNGGFKTETFMERDDRTAALLREAALELARPDRIYDSEFQRQPGESRDSHENRLRHEIEALKQAIKPKR